MPVEEVVAVKLLLGMSGWRSEIAVLVGLWWDAVDEVGGSCGRLSAIKDEDVGVGEKVNGGGYIGEETPATTWWRRREGGGEVDGGGGF